MYKLKKSHIALGLAALTIVSTIGISSATLAANTVDGINANATSTAAHLKFNKGFNHNKDANSAAQLTALTAKKIAVEAAIKANDYNAWVTAVGSNAPILQKINATNFSSFVQAYNLEQQANAIKTSLGLKGEPWGMLGMGNGHMYLNVAK